MKNRRGFSLMELTITLVIIGILVSLTVNVYISTIERGRWAEAREVLLKAYAGYQRALDDGHPVVNTTNFWVQLGMVSDPSSAKFVYSALSPSSVKAARSGNSWTIDLTTGIVTQGGSAPLF